MRTKRLESINIIFHVGDVLHYHWSDENIDYNLSVNGGWYTRLMKV